MVGDINVGKTNIVKRYINNSFDDYEPTIGVEFATKTIQLPNKQKVKVQIWDTCNIFLNLN